MTDTAFFSSRNAFELHPKSRDWVTFSRCNFSDASVNAMSGSQEAGVNDLSQSSGLHLEIESSVFEHLSLIHI